MTDPAGHDRPALDRYLRVRIPDAWRAEVELAAMADERTVSGWVRKLIRRELDTADYAGDEQ